MNTYMVSLGHTLRILAVMLPCPYVSLLAQSLSGISPLHSTCSSVCVVVHVTVSHTLTISDFLTTGGSPVR